MKLIRSILATSLSAALICSISIAPVHAHHSFGLYEMSKTAEIEGTVQKFEWSNPHCWLFVAVPASDGTDVTYGFELSSVGEMLRVGWTKTIVKPGDTVKVKFGPMRDGRPAGLLMSAMTADGKMIGKQVRGAPPSPQPE